MSEAPRSPGRPQSQRADRAILAATLKLLAEEGYAGMSMEAIAMEAGVGKSTIYRRYENKPEVVAAALESLVRDEYPTPDSDDTRLDVFELLLQTIQLFDRGAIFAMIGALLVEEQRNPELFEIFRRRIIHPRKQQFAKVIERGILRGEVREHISIDAATETLVGAVYARHISGMPLSKSWAEQLLDLVWHGLSA